MDVRPRPTDDDRSASDAVHDRQGGITVSSTVTVHRHGATVRGRTAAVENNDSLLAARIDECGTLDTFGVSANGASECTADVDVPIVLGPAALLVQDLESGRWSWHMPQTIDDVQRFTFEVPASPPPRGLIGAAARLLVKVVGAIGADKVVASAADWTISKWERAHRPSTIVRFPQIHSGHTTEITDLTRIAGGRSLLLLHDVFGSTAASFAGLPRWCRQLLHDEYDGRIWGFDHATLAVSPETNARRLVSLLEGSEVRTQVDIVAVGRGGLVAQQLAALSCAGVAVGRVVMVGAPLRGTPLCSGEHLTAFVNRYTNLLSLIPDNPVTTTLDAVCALVTQVGGWAIGDLPGLAAMAAGIDGGLPAGPEYAMIAGQSPPTRSPAWTRRLHDAVLDRLLGDAHDDVVAQSSAGDPVLGPVSPINGVSHRELTTATSSCEAIVAALGIVRDDPTTEVPGPTGDDSATTDSDRDTNKPAPTAPTAPTTRRYRERQTPTADDATIEAMDIGVIHGTIGLESNTVLVGHYMGTGFNGAEAALDVRTRGRMSMRHLVRLYPESIGESEILPNSSADGGTDFPCRVVIVGLGLPGELTKLTLTNTITLGLIRLALAEADRVRPGDTTEIQLSSVLIGTSGLAPLTVEMSIVGIVDGVLAANSRLREMIVDGRPLAERVRFGSLRFVELQEDVAEIAARVVRRVSDLIRPGWQQEVEIRSASTIERGDGGWPRRMADDVEANWQRVVVRQQTPTANDPTSQRPRLTYNLIGTAASTTEEVTRPNVVAVDSLLDGLIKSPGGDEASTLFELLVPRRLRSEIATADNLHFVVDKDTAKFPWEALIDRGSQASGDDPISRRAGFVRQFIDTEGTRGRPRVGDRRRALVIGNPPATSYPNLPGAAVEADRVADRLDRQQFDMTLLRWDAANVGGPSSPVSPALIESSSSARILSALHTGGFRILHIAAHGQVDTDPDRTGVVIGEDSFLTADDVRNLGEVPELVFLNCCHLGANPGLAANIAHAFMQSGALVVIAAGWPVADDAAVRFADRFYLEMLDGADFGLAIKQARRAAYRRGSDMTWAAYQCYGDPGYRLASRHHGGFGTRKMVSGAELLRSIEVINVQAADVGRSGTEAQAMGRARLVTKLHELHDGQLTDPGTDETAGKWLTATTYTALGDAAAALGDFPAAITWYGRALRSEKALAPVRVLEQLGNVEVRYAVQRARRGESYGEMLSAAIGHIQQALGIGPTVERFSLLGSYWKKCAVIASEKFAASGDAADRATRDEAVAQSIHFYGEAERINPNDSYPVLARVQLQLLDDAADATSGSQAVRTALSASARVDGSFWQRAAFGDGELTRMLGDDDTIVDVTAWYGPASGLPPELLNSTILPAQRIAMLYARAFELRSSWKERSSVLDHLRDLISLTEGNRQAGLVRVLDLLLDAICDLTGQDE